MLVACCFWLSLGIVLRCILEEQYDLIRIYGKG